ncbi:MAG: hypothetical protein RIS64_4058 [Bacteroidota bacterium]|jgi:hypothetical protein
MTALLELQQKVEQQPCLVHFTSDEHGTLKVSRQNFRIASLGDSFCFTYTENRDFSVNELYSLNTQKWLMKYSFSKNDLKTSEIMVQHTNTIQLNFQQNITLHIVNQSTAYEHQPIFVSEMYIHLLNMDQTLEVFNLLKRLKI